MRDRPVRQIAERIKAFRACGTIEGSRCSPAAPEAVRMIGLKVKKEWFIDPVQWELFRNRVKKLQSAGR